MYCDGEIRRIRDSQALYGPGFPPERRHKCPKCNTVQENEFGMVHFGLRFRGHWVGITPSQHKLTRLEAWFGVQSRRSVRRTVPKSTFGQKNKVEMDNDWGT